MKLTKEDFKELLLTIMAGIWVRSALTELRGEDFKNIEKWEEYFINMAKQLGYDELIETFHSKLIPHNDLALENEEEMSAYTDDVFWEELETRLGKRDFYKNATETELNELAKRQWFPEKVHKYYDKYRKEFEKYGIERLKIIKDKRK